MVADACQQAWYIMEPDTGATGLWTAPADAASCIVFSVAMAHDPSDHYHTATVRSLSIVLYSYFYFQI